MLLFSFLQLLSGVLSLSSLVAGIGSSCSSPLGPGDALPNDPYWLESIRHQGISTFNPNPNGYQVFRNVKDYGAAGDGVHDDTNAINNAISSGGRCGGGNCHSSTVTPALVYFPRGTYLISKPIIAYYFTQLVGDAKNPPTLLASPSFDGIAVIDTNPYVPEGWGRQWYDPRNNFYRAVRNFVIDTRCVPANKYGTGIHWQVAQATSLYNIVFQLSNAVDTIHQGIWMENGSGGFMGDLVINGGKFGIWGGNQQFTVRNLTINRAQTAVYSIWNWGFTYQSLTINDCGVGFYIKNGGVTEDSQATGAQAIIDAVVTNTPKFVETSTDTPHTLGGSIVLNNVRLNNVPVAVGVENGPTVLNGGTTTIDSWGQGNVYRGTNHVPTFTQGNLPAPSKPLSLLDGSGGILGRTRPQYASYSVNQIVSVRDLGAKGDGVTDDTAALENIFFQYAGCKIIFFDAGTYLVTNTITIPAATQMTGEVWVTLVGKGTRFQDQVNPRPVFKIGEEGSQGVIEISDIIFSTMGSAAGATVVEWNVKEPAGVKAGAGMWDAHIRLGGVAGSQLEGDECPKSAAGILSNCFAAYMGLHLKPTSSAYIEGAWVWLADHDLDRGDEGDITLYSGRGIFSESSGPVWLIGTGSEHHVLYQYSLVGAANHYMGLIQTETPYFQPSPSAPAPFQLDTTINDPTTGASAWGLYIRNSKDITIFGANLYSFFIDYSEDSCQIRQDCQDQIATIDTKSSGIHIYSLSTIGSTYQLSVNGSGVINQDDNRNGFASTVTSWSST